MTTARDQIYSFVNKRGGDMARYGPPAPYQKMIEAGSGDDDYLHALLNKVEDDRAHAEAEKLYAEAEKHKRSAGTASGPKIIDGHMAAWSNLMRAGQMIDPYEMRDGQLVRKSDGKPVTI